MPNSPNALQRNYRIFRVSLASLPYLYYISFVGILVVIVDLFRRFKAGAIDPFVRNSLLLVSGLLVLSACFAYNRGEAFLQLANFLPFFLLFAVLPSLLNRFKHLEQVAIDLVIATIPINLIAFVEYWLKSPYIPRSMRRIPVVHWLRAAPHKGRAMVMFDHPNALASYLVLVFGLGLGAILAISAKQRLAAKADSGSPVSRISHGWLYLGTFLNLLGIFSSGSRNGILVAVSQLLVFSLCVKASRTVLLAGLLSLFGVLMGAAVFGIGGRAMSIVDWTDDPRVGVWRMALRLIQEHPWLGWGLGNFKILYLIRRTDQDYPLVFHPHNFWLLLCSEAGIPVMLILTALVGYICFKAVRAVLLKQFTPIHNALLSGYLLAFWGCIAYALFDVTFYDARINILNWVLLAALYSSTAESSTADSS